MSGGKTAFDDVLTVSPTHLRDRRASTHSSSSRPALRDHISSELHDVTIVDSQEKDQSSNTSIPVLSELPSLHIDRKSASIPGYVPSVLGERHGSTVSTSGITVRETHFEDSYGPRSTGVVDTPNPLRLKRRLAISFFGFFCTGWSDGITGMVLPLFEETYHASYLTVSLLFVAQTVGYAIGTVTIEPLYNVVGQYNPAIQHRRFLPSMIMPIEKKNHNINPSTNTRAVSLSQGRCTILFLGGLCQCIYFSIAAAKSPFWAMMIGFGFAGTANSYLSGQSNVYVSSQKSAGRYLGWLHGCYGIGAFASPLVGQILLSRGWTWPQFFIVSACLAGLNTLGTGISFHTTREEFQEERTQALEMAREEIELEGTSREGAIRPQLRGRARTGASRSMMATLTHPIVWIFAAFLCLYNGSETTNGGWIVTFLLKERNANPNTVGYVASGFWGGVAMGRILIGQASPYIGIKRQKHLVHIYLAVALTMTILVWKIPSFLTNAFCTALIGFVLGPIYPISLTLATKLLPVEIHMTALATMSSCAQMGSAICPFVTGVLANAKGVVVLQPILLGVLSLMVGLWCLFPTRSI